MDEYQIITTCGIRLRIAAKDAIHAKTLAESDGYSVASITNLDESASQVENALTRDEAAFLIIQFVMHPCELPYRAARKSIAKKIESMFPGILAEYYASGLIHDSQSE